MTPPNGDDRRILKIKNKLGLHARASAKFVNVAAQYDAVLTVSKDGNSVVGTSIMGLMLLAAGIGDEIIVQCEGNEKTEALDAIEQLVNDKFGEEVAV